MSQDNPSQYHHHTPKFYLKGWATTVATVPDRVWIYTKNRSPRNAAIRRSAGRPNMYATVRSDGSVDVDRVERYLGTVETAAGRILPKILNREPITNKDKEAMALFISAMYRRGPYTMDAFAPDNLIPMLPQLREELIERSSNPNDSPELRIQKLAAIDQAIRDSEANISSPTSEAILSSGPMGNFFASLPWSYFYSDSDSFLTSDCPVIFNRGSGIREAKNSNIIFPFSSKLILLISPIMPRPDTYTAIPKLLVQDINRRIVCSSFEEVYSDCRTDWVEACVRDHIATALPRGSALNYYDQSVILSQPN